MEASDFCSPLQKKTPKFHTPVFSSQYMAFRQVFRPKLCPNPTYQQVLPVLTPKCVQQPTSLLFDCYTNLSTSFLTWTAAIVPEWTVHRFLPFLLHDNLVLTEQSENSFKSAHEFLFHP